MDVVVERREEAEVLVGITTPVRTGIGNVEKGTLTINCEPTVLREECADISNYLGSEAYGTGLSWLESTQYPRPVFPQRVCVCVCVYITMKERKAEANFATDWCSVRRGLAL